VGVLKGVVFFMSDLMRTLTIPARMDFHGDLTVCAARPSQRASPSDQGSGRNRRCQHVIFVEDIIDTGLTLNYLLRTLKTAARPA